MCSFENMFTPNVAQTVGTNLQTILGISDFDTDEMVRQAPMSYTFYRQHREANRIRDKLPLITTDAYSHVWFSIRDNPLDGLYDKWSMQSGNLPKIKDYPVFYDFGSMYSYNTFQIHSKPYPAMHNLRIIEWKEEPSMIRITSRDESLQIMIPIMWIQDQVLVRTRSPSCVVLMLTSSVIIKRKILKTGSSAYER